MNINRVLLVGNLTKDPELRHTPSGTAVCDFSIAINGREKIGDTWQDRADFFDVVVWGNQAENCAQHLSRGSMVGVDGKLRQDRWEDRDTGQKRSKVKITADTVQFLNNKRDDAESGGGGQFVPQAQQEPDFSNDDSDIPF